MSFGKGRPASSGPSQKRSVGFTDAKGAKETLLGASGHSRPKTAGGLRTKGVKQMGAQSEENLETENNNKERPSTAASGPAAGRRRASLLDMANTDSMQSVASMSPKFQRSAIRRHMAEAIAASGLLGLRVASDVHSLPQENKSMSTIAPETSMLTSKSIDISARSPMTGYPSNKSPLPSSEVKVFRMQKVRPGTAPQRQYGSMDSWHVGKDGKFKGLKMHSRGITPGTGVLKIESGDSTPVPENIEKQKIPIKDSRLPMQFAKWSHEPFCAEDDITRREEVKLENGVWKQKMFPSRHPSAREEARDLSRTMDEMLEGLDEVQTADQDPMAAKKLLEVYDVILDEIIRQVYTHCKDRGVLLERIANRYRQLFTALPTLLMEKESELGVQRDIIQKVEERLSLVTSERDDLLKQTNQQKKEILELKDEVFELRKDLGKLEKTSMEVHKEKDNALEEAQKQQLVRVAQERLNEDLIEKNNIYFASISRLRLELAGSMRRIASLEAEKKEGFSLLTSTNVQKMLKAQRNSVETAEAKVNAQLLDGPAPSSAPDNSSEGEALKNSPDPKEETAETQEQKQEEEEEDDPDMEKIKLSADGTISSKPRADVHATVMPGLTQDYDGNDDYMSDQTPREHEYDTDDANNAVLDAKSIDQTDGPAEKLIRQNLVAEKKAQGVLPANFDEGDAVVKDDPDSVAQLTKQIMESHAKQHVQKTEDNWGSSVKGWARQAASTFGNVAPPPEVPDGPILPDKSPAEIEQDYLEYIDPLADDIESKLLVAERRVATLEQQTGVQVRHISTKEKANRLKNLASKMRKLHRRLDKVEEEQNKPEDLMSDLGDELTYQELVHDHGKVDPESGSGRIAERLKSSNLVKKIEGRRRFLSLIDTRDKRKRARPLKWTLQKVRSILVDKYLEDQRMERQHKVRSRLPEFVVSWFYSKSHLRSVACQGLWDLHTSLRHWRSEDVEVDLFLLFLDEHYTVDQLTFYLYCRCKVMAQHVGIGPDDASHVKRSVTLVKAVDIINSLFASVSKERKDVFFVHVEGECFRDEKTFVKKIEVFRLLHLLVQEFRNVQFLMQERFIDLFVTFDENRTGKISQQDFISIIKTALPKIPSSHLESVFEEAKCVQTPITPRPTDKTLIQQKLAEAGETTSDAEEEHQGEIEIETFIRVTSDLLLHNPDLVVPFYYNFESNYDKPTTELLSDFVETEYASIEPYLSRYFSIFSRLASRGDCRSSFRHYQYLKDHLKKELMGSSPARSLSTFFEMVTLVKTLQYECRQACEKPDPNTLMVEIKSATEFLKNSAQTMQKLVS